MARRSGVNEFGVKFSDLGCDGGVVSEEPTFSWEPVAGVSSVPWALVSVFRCGIQSTGGRDLCSGNHLAGFLAHSTAPHMLLGQEGNA